MSTDETKSALTRKVKTIEIVTRGAPGMTDQIRAEAHLDRRELVVIRHVIPAGEEGFVYLTYSDGKEKEIALAQELTVVDYAVNTDGFSELNIKYYPDENLSVEPPAVDSPFPTDND